MFTAVWLSTSRMLPVPKFNESAYAHGYERGKKVGLGVCFFRSDLNIT